MLWNHALSTPGFNLVQPGLNLHVDPASLDILFVVKASVAALATAPAARALH
jgi:hypothetical protein